MQFDATIYTFGFGSDHDASLLENIATQGGGVYYFVESDTKVSNNVYTIIICIQYILVAKPSQILLKTFLLSLL